MQRTRCSKVFSTLAFVVTGILMTSNMAHAATEKFVLVSHAPDSDSWWNTIKNAIK